MEKIRGFKGWCLLGVVVFILSGGAVSYAQVTHPGNVEIQGNLGIGTANPDQPLHLKGAAGSTLRFENTDESGSQDKNIGTIEFEGRDLNAVGVRAKIQAAYQNASSATYMAFSTANSLDSTITERMRIIADGKVGIGTMSPTARLHVAGDARITGDLTTDGNIAAKYQDIAEWVPTAAILPPGTVVVIDPQETNRVLPASKPYDTRVAGVVSAQPGIILGEAGEDKVKVAHSGRVKVKADAQFGPIEVGDLVVSSATTGYAMRSTPVDISGVSIHRPGTIVGKALEPLKEGKGEILVLLTLQ